MQNNSQNKALKIGGGKQGASIKNNRAINEALKDVNFQIDAGLDVHLPKDIHIARIVKKLGHARFEVIYALKKEIQLKDLDGNIVETKATYQLKEQQVTIPGKFKGRSKRAVWFEVNSIVIIQDGQLMALMTREQLKDISKEMYIHPQILAENQGSREDSDIGIEFGDDSDEETNVVSKKDKEKHNRQNIPTLDVNIDDI